MKTYTCKDCNIEFKTFQAKANHVRWHHKDNNEYLKKAIEAGKKVADKRFGKLITETVNCSICDKSIKIEYREGKKKAKYFCSRSCANTRKNRSEETKAKIAKTLKSKTKYLEKECPHCGTLFESIKRLNRKYCSTKCAASSRKRTDDSLRTYRLNASFNFNLADYPEEFDFSLIEKYGWYSASNRGNNLNGVSRDHMVSVKFGYENNIDPKIIGHPANCRLMRHNDNVSKYEGCSITLKELKLRIEKWNNKYNKGC